MEDFKNLTMEELREERRKSQQELEDKKFKEKQKQQIEDEVVGRSMAFRLLKDHNLINKILKEFASGADSVTYYLDKGVFKYLGLHFKKHDEGILKEMNEFLSPHGIIIEGINWYTDVKTKLVKTKKPKLKFLVDLVCSGDVDSFEYESRIQEYKVLFLKFKED